MKTVACWSGCERVIPSTARATEAPWFQDQAMQPIGSTGWSRPFSTFQPMQEQPTKKTYELEPLSVASIGEDAGQHKSGATHERFVRLITSLSCTGYHLR
jgi:hypothetical protein